MIFLFKGRYIINQLKTSKMQQGEYKYWLSSQDREEINDPAESLEKFGVPAEMINKIKKKYGKIIDVEILDDLCYVYFKSTRAPGLIIMKSLLKTTNPQTNQTKKEYQYLIYERSSPKLDSPARKPSLAEIEKDPSAFE